MARLEPATYRAPGHTAPLESAMTALPTPHDPTSRRVRRAAAQRPGRANSARSARAKRKSRALFA
ncbi:hypothetical protein, partial [Nocardia sp. NPDC003979]